MSAKKYQKKPIIIEAFQPSSLMQEIDFPFWFVRAVKAGDIRALRNEMTLTTTYMIKTLEGEMTASPGDYIIRGIQEEIYPCKPDIFEASYEEVQE